ncbi:MAG: hypothetical protein Q7R56_03600 [Nanoarchaeota archaeon]|nr:hypothetical protein [Nanoarchaeota archaeon]
MHKKGYSLFITILVAILFMLVAMIALFIAANTASIRTQELQQAITPFDNELQLQAILHYHYEGKTLATWLEQTYNNKKKDEQAYENFVNGIYQYYAGKNYFYVYRIEQEGSYEDSISMPSTIQNPFNYVVKKQQYERALANNEGAQQELPNNIIIKLKQEYFTMEKT